MRADGGSHEANRRKFAGLTYIHRDDSVVLGHESSPSDASAFAAGENLIWTWARRKLNSPRAVVFRIAGGALVADFA